MDQFTNTLSSALSHSPDYGTAVTVSATCLATIALYSLSLSYKHLNRKKLIRSPAFTLLPNLSPSERANLEYPPDVLPGGRSVNTPFGVIRVYEWGPEDGQKVLFVHGITTTCISLGSLAQGMVDKGYRVMLFDLWGRGYSDCPADLPHDERLYATQILLAITSSPLSWTGSSPENKFNIIGYSLGGGISATFTANFPDMVKRLILISPTGLVRAKHGFPRTRFRVVSRLVPNAILNPGLRKFLTTDLTKPKDTPAGGDGENVKDIAEAEVQKPNSSTKSRFTPLSLAYPNITLITSGLWHIKEHVGLIESFKSTIRYGPIMGREDAYKRLGERADKILVVSGKLDKLIIPEELEEDVKTYIGNDKVVYKSIHGSHDIPYTHSKQLLDMIQDFWSK